MKKYIILPLLLSGLLSFTACEKLLDKEPTDRISLEDLLKDTQGGKTALAGAYSSLLSSDHYQRNSLVYQDLLGGNIKFSQTVIQRLQEVYNGTQTAVNSEMNGTYSQLYSEENNVNNILQYLPSASGSATDKLKIIAEARCLRALIHFDLLRTFARPYGFTANADHPGVVINLKPRLIGDPSASRATVGESYQSVISDLEEAISSFDDSNVAVLSSGYKQNYFTKSSAKALLAKVYLYTDNWEKAYTLADEVIKSNVYTLLTNANYVASWTGRVPSAESIFEIPLETNFSGTSLGSYYDLTDNTYRMFAATNDLLTLYSADDVRCNPFLFSQLSVNGTPFYFSKKYATGGVNATPLKVLRLSELYLIRAEAAVEKSTADLTIAKADLNRIRMRGDAKATASDYTTKADLINAIMLERRKELAFEGNLLYDLTRRNLAVTRTDCNAKVCDFAAGDYRLVMPFPSTTINANFSVLQNTGY